MSDWQVGDLAVCVTLHDVDEWINCTGDEDPIPGPRKGEVFRAVWCGTDWDGVYALEFAEFSGERWAADDFRKIRPDEHEACEPEFVTLIKRAKRTVTA